MPKSAIERRLLQAFTELNPALKDIISPAFKTTAAVGPVRAADRLRLVKPGPASVPGQTPVVDQLEQLKAIAPQQFKEMRKEIAGRLLIAQRAQTAHIDCSSRKPWPWPLFDAVRKAPGASAAATILLTILDVTTADFPDIIKFAEFIRSADQPTARILLNYLLEEYVPLSAAARFAWKG